MLTRMWLIAGMMLAVNLFALIPAQVLAQEAERLLKQDIDRREQERRDRRREEAHSPGPLLLAPENAVSPISTASKGPCFPVQQIQLQPDNILDSARSRRIIAAWTGRCLSASDLAAVQEALNTEALAEGLVTTRVVIPEQNLASGQLQLAV